MIKKIAIGADHAGFDYKNMITDWLLENDYEFLDMGTDSAASVDYPDFIHPVADSIEDGSADLGIIICGSGNGVAMTANKHKGIRAAIAWNEELAILARQHNDANVVAIPARFISKELALSIIQAFLKTAFEGGRHERRVRKIAFC
ncbi:MAG: ribose 5-phosphate isomerase B [Saprospiraceae bacterium]|jgi:ribose 5-phosphate isomerase B